MTVSRMVAPKAPAIPPTSVTVLIPPLAAAVVEGLWVGIDVRVDVKGGSNLVAV